MAARSLIAAAGLALACGAAGCSGSSDPVGGGPATPCAAAVPGVQATLRADQAFTAADVDLLRRRVSAAAGSCADVGLPGATTLVVKLPGLDRSRAGLLLSPGRPSFDTWMPASSPISAPPPGVAASFVPVSEGGSCAASTATIECIPSGYLPSPTGVAGAMITSARETRDPTTSQPTLVFVLSDAGTALLARVTAALPGQAAPLNQLAIFVDDVMIDNASVQSALTNGEVQVGGGRIDSDPHYAADLVAVLSTNQVRPFAVASLADLR